VVSGSEVGWELSQTQAGAAFLDKGFGAKFLADDSASYAVTGEGALAGFATFTYGGPKAPYAEDYPDALKIGTGGSVVLRYGSGQAAAVGIAGKGVLVGFPLELVDDPATRAALVAKLVKFAGG
jgi:hypothetical protein